MFKTQTNHQNQNKTRQNKVRNKNFKSNRESISGSVIGSKNIQNINKSPKAKQIRGEQNNWIDKILKKTGNLRPIWPRSIQPRRRFPEWQSFRGLLKRLWPKPVSFYIHIWR